MTRKSLQHVVSVWGNVRVILYPRFGGASFFFFLFFLIYISVLLPVNGRVKRAPPQPEACVCKSCRDNITAVSAARV